VDDFNFLMFCMGCCSLYVLLYIFVVLTIWGYMFDIYIYQPCFVSCIIDVIHAEIGNILILLYSGVEFYFCWFETDNFLCKYSNYYSVR
jgi:hypothetical protein